MKWLLIASLVGFAVGFVELTQPDSWALGVPFGAVFLGVFVVIKVFGKELANYDEEQQTRGEIADRGAAASHSK